MRAPPQGDRHHVITCGPNQVLDHLAVRGPAQFHNPHNVEGITFHQDDVRGLHRDIRPTANGNTNIGAGQGGSVVHAIPHHRHLFPLRLQFPDFLILVFG